MQKEGTKRANTYQKEYIQSQINKIINSVEDRQSRIAWQTVNKVSKMKSISSAKLKAVSQEERIQMWKDYFKNLFANSPEVTDRPITKNINSQQEIKLGQFTPEELNIVLKKK